MLAYVLSAGKLNASAGCQGTTAIIWKPIAPAFLRAAFGDMDAVRIVGEEALSAVISFAEQHRLAGIQRLLASGLPPRIARIPITNVYSGSDYSARIAIGSELAIANAVQPLRYCDIMVADPERGPCMSFKETTAEDGGENAFATLNAIEARILGCLIEKEATTPEVYPLTANAVVMACNQKNNREPVLELALGEVGHALRAMTDKGMVRVVDGARAQRYEHRFAQAWSVTTRQQALLAVMLLRGPQTLAELHTRSERLAAPADLEDVRFALERLTQRAQTLVVNLGRAAGQREDRYMHLLCGPVSAADFAVASDDPPASSKRGGFETRLGALEAEVSALRCELDALRECKT